VPGTILLIAGNTNCRLALVRGRTLHPVRLARTDRVIENPARLLSGLRAEDAALASVVPRATRPLARALKAVTARAPFVVSARARTGLRVRYDRRTLGADRLCVAEGAAERWTGDLAVADFGTAVTLNFVDRERCFRGGPILPGPALMLSALGRGTAALPVVRFRPRVGVFTRETGEALAAGALAAVAGGVERALIRAEAETGRRWRLIGTGGTAGLLSRHMPRMEAVDSLLGLRGLGRLFRLNRPGPSAR